MTKLFYPPSILNHALLACLKKKKRPLIFYNPQKWLKIKPIHILRTPHKWRLIP